MQRHSKVGLLLSQGTRVAGPVSRVEVEWNLGGGGVLRRDHLSVVRNASSVVNSTAMHGLWVLGPVHARR